MGAAMGCNCLERGAHRTITYFNDPTAITEDLQKAKAHFKPGEDPCFPADLLILAMGEEKRELLMKAARENPRTTELDPVTIGVFKRLQRLNAVDYAEILTTHPATAPRKKMDTMKFSCFDIAEFEEEESKICKDFLYTSLVDIAEGVLNVAPMYDETSPVFFESKDEAAVFFDLVLRPHLPTRGWIVDGLCTGRHVDGDLEAVVFGGVGQWFLVAIVEGTWARRQAPASVVPPTGSVVVLDMSKFAKYPVRDGFARYGGAAFFGEDKAPLGIWLAEEQRMVTPDADPSDWLWAQWLFKSTIFLHSFGGKHLVEIHWITSNSMNMALRVSLEPTHPLRRFMKPFTHRSITINRLAVSTLCSTRGIISRIGSHEEVSISQILMECAAEFRYESFEEHVASMGELPAGMLDSLPYVEDGLRLEAIIRKFVKAFLEQFYGVGDGKKKVSDDMDLVAFWKMADCCAMTGRESDGQGARKFGLPELTIESLAAYLVHFIFTSTALHELLASQTMNIGLPTTQNGRVLSRDKYETAGFGFQASVQDWCRTFCITAATTTVPMPMLIPEMRHVATKYESGQWYGQDPELAKIHTKFADDLDTLAEQIKLDNQKRKHVFGSFNPIRHEVSVSL